MILQGPRVRRKAGASQWHRENELTSLWSGENKLAGFWNRENELASIAGRQEQFPIISEVKYNCSKSQQKRLKFNLNRNFKGTTALFL